VQSYFVNIAEMKVCREPDAVYAVGLGSCIGVVLYDPTTKIGGMLHVLLPSSEGFDMTKNVKTKFGDIGVKELLDAMLREGAKRQNLRAKIAGGAMMFPNKSDLVGTVGERNIVSCKKSLQELGIRLVAEDVGGTKGRTIELNTTTGDLKVKIVQVGEKYI
jgi:chemotaxis protein CheD